MSKLVFIVLFQLSISSTALARTPLHIMIDPGHGGHENPGAMKHKVREADLSLAISKRLKKLLHKNKNFKVSMSRETNTDISLSDRVLKARQKNVDLFVSIHLNSSINQKARGLEVYYQNQLDPDEESQFLASRENFDEAEDQKQWTPKHIPKNSTADVKNILRDLDRDHRRRQSFLLAKDIFKYRLKSSKKPHQQIFQAPFYVLTQTHVPAVLVELGFLTNPKELKKLQKPHYQNKLARSIFKGLLKYQRQL